MLFIFISLQFEQWKKIEFKTHDKLMFSQIHRENIKNWWKIVLKTHAIRKLKMRRLMPKFVLQPLRDK